MARLITFALLLTVGAVLAQTPETSWLDRPLSNWNTPGSALPRAMPVNGTMAETMKRCAFPAVLRGTPGERALADAGWRPFHLFDRQIVQRDVEIVGGLAGADGMCRPLSYNAFVFVSGELAGTLSPSQMDSRTDGSIGVVRLAEDDTIAAEFARFAATDPLCCPSGRVTVRYHIDRKATPPVVVPVNVRTIRQ
jgi:LppP/LprE lipoprotein